MARLAGIDLNDKWNIDYALTNIKGVGWSMSSKILEKTKIDPKKKVSDLTNENIVAISGELEKIETEGDLARKVRENVSRLQQISSYKGIRHQRGLPARGQRTKTNARTKRGKRKTVGSFKKEELVKQTQDKKE